MREKKTGVFVVVWLITILLLPLYVNAQEYYADVIVEVGTDGLAEVSGISNHPLLIEGKTEAFTSKKGSVWLFNISPEEKFSNFTFNIMFPKDAALSYVKAPSQVKISKIGDRLAVIGSGDDERFYVLVQYSFEREPKKDPFTNMLVWFGPPIMLILVGSLIYFIAKKSANHSKKDVSLGTSSTYNPDMLTDRERQILEIVRNSKSPLTQAMVERNTRMPKSALSRHIDKLVKKGIIQKERKGMSNILTFVK